MMNETRSTYLRHLDRDDENATHDRTRLVCALREAAARIKNVAHVDSFGAANGAQVSGLMTKVHFELAEALLDHAQRICDHGDVTDSRCRGCGAIIPGSPHGARVIG